MARLLDRLGRARGAAPLARHRLWLVLAVGLVVAAEGVRRRDRRQLHDPGRAVAEGRRPPRGALPVAVRRHRLGRVPGRRRARSPTPRTSPRSARCRTALAKLPHVTGVTGPATADRRRAVRLAGRHDRLHAGAVRRAVARPRQGRVRGDRGSIAAGGRRRVARRVRRRPSSTTATRSSRSTATRSAWRSR